MHFPFHFKHQRHKREKKERKMMAILVHDFVPLVNSFLRYDIRWFKTLSSELGDVGLDDGLHLGLDLLGQDTSTELLEETLVLGLELLNAGC
jgi:hypothetical protein